MKLPWASVDLPRRARHIVGPLPVSFEASQLDSMPESFCWFSGSWLASTDAWGDRRLGWLDPKAGRWRQFAAPPGWLRQPVTLGPEEFTSFGHERNDDKGRLLAYRSGHWHTLAADVDGASLTDRIGVRFAQRDRAGNASAFTQAGEYIHVRRVDGRSQIVVDGNSTVIPLPKGATVAQLAPSPDRSLLAVVIRCGSAFATHVFSLRTGMPAAPGSFRQQVHTKPVWLDCDRLILVVERWPSLVPLVWRWGRNQVDECWPAGTVGAVRSLAVSPRGTCAAAVSTPLAPRGLATLDGLRGPVGVADREVRTVIVETEHGQGLPCLVYEPPGTLRGTVFYFPGGPHEPMWAEYSAFSHAMSDDGWRVVRPNLRSSGLREPQFRPVGTVRYGIDDVCDALAVIAALGVGPVATMGMSYGGYIAALAGEWSDRCRAVAVLSGFLSRRDLDGSTHPDVLRFTAEAFTQVPQEPAELTKHYFIAHGSADPRVPIDAVRAHAVKAPDRFTFVELSGQGHAILSDLDARLTYPRLLAWLQEKASDRRSFATYPTR